MSMRIILAPLFGSEVDTVTLASALDLGGRLGAHVDALFARDDPLDAVPLVGEGVSPSVIEQLTEAAKAEMDRRQHLARASFDAAVEASGVALVEGPAGPTGATARWLELIGRRDEVVPTRASTSDLVVFGRSGTATIDETRPTIETTLLRSGRPVLIAPAAAPTGIGRKVAIAWNGRAEAVRAVVGAMPLLATAERVQVLTATTRRTDFKVSLGLVEYLGSHGVISTCEAVEPEEVSVGAALLRVARENGADLVVMGGYGHARFRELVLGGVTLHALAHAEPAVLVAH